MLYPDELRAPKETRMVGVEGFEPPTPCSQSRCATRLRYTPYYLIRNNTLMILLCQVLKGIIKRIISYLIDLIGLMH